MLSAVDHGHQRTYLLVASMPTPNGRLHLGHIGGPFLRLDVAARLLRSRGHRAFVVSGVDAYESHVLLKAEREQRSPVDVAQSYCRGILDDLSSLQIACDDFVDPLSTTGRELYERRCLGVIERLVEVGCARPETRRFPCSPESGRWVPRSFISGECPSCGAPASGCVCEACGHQFLVEELKRPRQHHGAAGGADDIAWRSASCLTMRAPDSPALLEALAGARLPRRYAEIVERHIETFGAQMELTIPGDFGVRWPGALDPADQVVFTYCTPYAWQLLAGELCGTRSGDDRNAFEVGSEVITVVSFGADITVPFVFGTIAFALADGAHRRFDHYWANEFLRLEGEKFSTSRGHAIWSADLVQRTPATSDMVRYYLALINPEDEETDFVVDDFVRVVNDVVVGRIHRRAADALESLRRGPPRPPSAQILGELSRFLEEQSRDLDLTDFRLKHAPAIVSAFADDASCRAAIARGEAYWWLKGLSILSYPLMPSLGQTLWSSLGAAGEPNLEEFLEVTQPLADRPSLPLRPICREDLAPCLPATLR